MYDEYNKEVTGNEADNKEAGNSEEGYRPEEHVPNFIMKDSQTNQEQGVQRWNGGQDQQGGQNQQTSLGQQNWQNGQNQQSSQNWQSGQNQQSSQNWQNGQNQQSSQNWQSGQNQQSGQDWQSGQNQQSGQNWQSGQNQQNRTQQDSQNSYGTQSYNWQNSQSSKDNCQDEKQSSGKKKKSGSMARKIAGITAAALLFGVVSGGTMVGVNMLADSMKEETYPQVTSQEVLADAETKDNNSAGLADSAVPAVTTQLLDVSQIVENAMPSVVAINNTTLYTSSNWWGMSQTYEVPSSGSGIIVGQNEEELLIATNNHVVEDSQTLSVVFIDETSVNAAIKGTDPDMDLAVIAVALKDIPEETLSQITVAQMGNSDDLKVGQGVIAIGNALGYGQSVTVGYVSALNREITTDGSTVRNLLQTDAAINPGNSGGALLNMKGEVIGINAAKYSSTDVEGIGYAIPISKAQDILSTLMTRKTRTEAVEEGKEGYLGIQGLTVDDSMVKQFDMPAGVYVYGIIDGGAASKSDLREKDIITKFDGQTVRSMAAMQDLLKYYKAGETVELTVRSLENGEYVERVVTITLAEKATLGQDAQNQTR